MKQRSFTLIELLVVISIVGLISSIVLVQLGGTRAKARLAKGLQFSQSILNALGSEAAGIWDFDEGAGVTAGDRSGYNNNGTINNGATWSCAVNDTPSGKGCSLNFDGIDDYVSIPDNSALDIDNFPLTLSAWIYCEDVPNSYGVINKGSGTWAGKNYYLGLSNSGKIRVSFGDGVADRIKESNAVLIDRDKWHHLVGVINNNNDIRIYVDGVGKDGSYIGVAVNISSNALPLLIASHNLTTHMFKGKIDEVRIFRGSFTQTEIQKLYVEGLKRHLAEK